MFTILGITNGEIHKEKINFFFNLVIFIIYNNFILQFLFEDFCGVSYIECLEYTIFLLLFHNKIFDGEKNGLFIARDYIIN